MTKILYIAGYGKSGSTILSLLLGKAPQVVAVGEIAFLPEQWDKNQFWCSCGKPYRECEFWCGSSLQEIPDAMKKNVLQIERVQFLPRLLTGKLPRQQKINYQQYQKHIFEYISRQSAADIIVDTSKSARFRTGRFYALHTLTDYDVYVIHLVRSGISTMESVLSPKQSGELPGNPRTYKRFALRAIIGWLMANILTIFLGKLMGKERYFRLRYEDFIEDPDEALQKIGDFCGFDTSKIDCSKEIPVSHYVDGNRIRLQKTVRLDTSQPLVDTNLKWYQRILFYLLAGWLEKYFGYL